ncbi:hypothetical protein ACFOZ0_02895 [Streptomyces yaanensis]|uniref:Uncharacterized protein n=1 Tax=Streptomyces yaanensis TaxID=1142239 RepID=A0ABV7S5B0_9ACTN|nr:hypothetical protein [Streptomyces sp. CGMCC 4.7035]WNB99826.1 hypothetical protein Q2K21_18110 [Streptomyces sp. CGMCC 4.7035]
MTIVRRRIALIAGTMVLAGAASSGVAMASTPASTPTAAHTSIQNNGGFCNFRGGWGGNWGGNWWNNNCGFGGFRDRGNFVFVNFNRGFGGYGGYGGFGGYGGYGGFGGYGGYGGYGGFGGYGGYGGYGWR